ncbi:putative ribonuclease H-like domain-containing protein [Tanacetum coccineum]
MTHPSPKKNMVPGAVLMRSCLVSLTTAKPLNTAQPRTTVNRNMSYLTNYEEIDGGYVAFGGNPKGGKITGKCTIKTGIVSLNDTECIVLSPNFKLTDESQVLLKVPRKNNMYSVDLKNVVPKGGLTCLFAKATSDESKLWHRRLGHINFKTMNKLIKGNLVRGLPSKLFENNKTCVACQKGKQHRASFKSKIAEAVNTACYIQNKVLVTKPHNKTPYELFPGRKPALGFMRPFGYLVTILNTIDHLGKFDAKADEGFFFGKNTPNLRGSGLNWLFDIYALTKSMNYKSVVAGNQSNGSAGTKACDDAGKARMETVPSKDYILLPLWTADPPFSQSSKSSPDAGFKPSADDEKKVTEELRKQGGYPSKEDERDDKEKNARVVEKCKTNLGYNVVLPLYTGNFMPLKPDLSFSGLEEFMNEPIVSEHTVKKPVVETSEAKANADKPKEAKIEKKIVKPSFAKIKFVKSKEQVKSPRKTTVKQGNQNRLNTHSPRGNQRNWNNMMSQRLRSNFKMINKACYVCGSFDHLQYDCNNHQRQFNNKKMVKPVWNYTQRVNYQNVSRMTHPSPKRNMVPKAVLIRSGLVSITTATSVNTAQPRTTVNSASPMTNVFNKEHSTVRRPINKNPTFKNINFNQRVNTVKDKNVNVARPKVVVNAVRPKAVLNAVKGNQVNAVKDSACWVWKPKTKGNPQQDLQEKGVIDSGCSRHMTGNMSYLTDFEEIDGGYVAFGGNPKGGKITGRGTIKTGNLDFKNVYFVRELKFNLFSVSQMYEKNNSVLFNDTECIVLSPNFKLTYESHVLLKVPRKNNMYSIDLKNTIPKRGLTCLFVKATSDESKLWHRRIGHINFKTMNKLVKGNLVRGLPSKRFEIHQTCVACQKGKQHRASCNSKTSFITGVENLIDQRVKVIRCDNGTEFKNKEMNQFCKRKGIKREFSVARTPQQNRVAERKNRTLIEAARTMLADSKLPTTFWAEAVNTACYVQNRVLVTKPHNKTPYELFLGRKPALGFMRPFGCPVTILNTIDHLGKFDGKADEGFFVGYSINSKAFRVFNSRTRIVEENLHVYFSENKPNIAGSGPNWLFDIDALTKLMNYKPVVIGNQHNGNAGTKACDDAGKARMETSSPDAGFKPSGDDEKKVTEEPGKEDGDSSKDGKSYDQEKEDNVNITNTVNAASTNEVNVVDAKTSIELPNDPNMPELEDIVYSDDDEDLGAEADMNNLDAFMPVSPIPTTRIHKDHPVEQIIRDLNSTPQTRRMTKNLEEHEEPKKVIHALKDPSWIEAMQEELLQFKLQEVWTLMELPNGKRAIRTKWVFRNKKDERGIVIKNKARLVAQRYTQEEGIEYDEVFALVARIEEIRLFLAYASFKDFVVYQMDVKSAFLYGKIEEEVYVCQPPGFEDPNFLDRINKVEKALYGLHQAPRAWDKCDILLVQVYVDDIIIGSTKKSLCTEFEKMMHKKFQMSKAKEGWDFYQLRHIPSQSKGFTSSCCEKNFKYLKGQPKLGLWYLKDSPFYLIAYTDSDYAGASLDRKSTIGGCQFLGSRLISWQYLLTKAFDNGIGVNAGDSKLMLLGINLLLLGKVNAARHNLQLLVNVNAVEAKTVNGKVQLQALVDGKKIIVTEASVRRDLQLEDEEGTDCLPNATIFEELTRMGHKKIYVTPSHTKKIFGNIRRVGKGFSGRDTPLFPTMMVQAQQEQGEGSAMPTDPQHTPTIIQPLTSYPQRPRKPKRKDTEIPQSSVPSDNVADEAVNEEMNDNLERAATTATSLDAEHDKGNINKTQSKATPNEPSSPRTSSGGGPRRQETIGDTIAQTRSENVSKFSNDPLLTRVLDLENTKTAQAQEITSLKLRVKKLEKKGGSRTYKLKRLYKVGRSARIVSSDEASLDVEITLVDETQWRYGDDIMFDVSDLAGEEVFVAKQGVPDSKKDDAAQVNTPATTVSTSSTIPVSAALITDVEITLAQALAELKSAKPTTATSTRPRAKGLLFMNKSKHLHQ